MKTMWYSEAISVDVHRTSLHAYCGIITMRRGSMFVYFVGYRTNELTYPRTNSKLLNHLTY